MVKYVFKGRKLSICITMFSLSLFGENDQYSLTRPSMPEFHDHAKRLLEVRDKNDEKRSCSMEKLPYGNSLPDGPPVTNSVRDPQMVDIPINYHVIYVEGDFVSINVQVDNQPYEHCMWDIWDYQNETFLIYPGFGFDNPGHSYSQAGVLPPGDYALFIYDDFGSGGVSGNVTSSDGTVLATLYAGSYTYYTFLDFTAPSGTYTDGLLPISTIESQTELLNNAYNEFGYSFHTASVDSAINAGWFYATDSKNYDTGQWECEDQYLAMANSMTVDVSNSVNYFWTGARNSQGMGVFPWSFPEDDPIHGLFCGFYTAPGGEPPFHLGMTGVHEIGHYLGLYHTFENGCTSPGDEVEDTPYQADPNFDCPSSHYSCSSYDDIGNFMDYVDDDCMTHFSSGQKDRIHWAIETYRPTLLEGSIDPAIVSVINEFEEEQPSDIADSIFFVLLDEEESVTFSYDSVDHVSGNGAMDVTFRVGSTEYPGLGNWTGIGFMRHDSTRMDLSAGDTLSLMMKVEVPPSVPQYMSLRIIIVDRPVFYGFDEVWACEETIILDTVSDWTELKIPIKPHMSSTLYPILNSGIDDGFNLSPYWWGQQYNNWQLDRDRVMSYQFHVGINGYGDFPPGGLDEDSVRVSFDYLTLKDSSGYEHVDNFNDDLDEICLSPIVQRQDLVDDIMGSLPSFPYIEPMEGLYVQYAGGVGDNEDYAMAHYLYSGTHGYVAVPGSWNNWNGTLWNLSNIPGTDLWFRPMIMPNHGRFNYAYYADGSWYDDPLNDVSCMDWNGNMSDQVNGPEYVSPPELVYNDTIFHGTLFDTVFYSSSLGNSRPVTVYLPPGYESSSFNYPVVFYHDGDRFLERDIENVLDNLIDDERVSPLIAVLIPPVNRTEEYAGTQQAAYAELITGQIFPWAMSKYRILEGPENHASFGFSDGGNISLFLSLNRFDVFGRVGGYSPTINSGYNTLVTDLSQITSPPDLDFYLESYWYDNLLFGVLAFRDTLESLGYDVLFTDYPDGHEWCRVMGNQDVGLEYIFPYQQLSLDKQDASIPLKFGLHQNYPNPFNPSTSIRYDLPEDAFVNITIYDMMGRSVKIVSNDRQTAGYKIKKWDATNELGEPVSTGVYLYSIRAGDFMQVKKMALLK